ncbi:MULTISPECIES: SMC-Scp complex subunit ScpB [Allobacillus]|uniref:Segregation and condensation protein B n=1 Tax=Allobacillus salarius TaxID=1955272 RepID=A0A556PT91_9BACI|nr:SMC-Scp complex subunit ScpB [Allobacillus salarius]TSJ67605.1 SMC-Scp complex subunit ScpB [Allobacillus salarius]
MELNEMKGVLEGLLFVSGDEGLSNKQIKNILEIDEDAITLLLNELKYDYEHGQRGLSILEVRGIHYLTTKPDHAVYYEKMQQSNVSSRLSQASLETLAIVAYKQPITKVEMEEIRGVKCDGPVQTLMSRYLIEEAGRKDTSGRPILYQTTREFLTFFGLTSLDDLPPLTEEDLDQTLMESDLFFTELADENEKAAQ